MSGKESFFRELQLIQDTTVNVLLSKEDKYQSTRDILIDATYETICRVLEVLDGYNTSNIQYEVTEMSSRQVINKTRNMHDACEDYLMFTDN